MWEKELWLTSNACAYMGMRYEERTLEQVQMSVGCVPTVSMACGPLWHFQHHSEVLHSSPARLKQSHTARLAQHKQTPDSHSVTSDVTLRAVSPVPHNNPESLLFVCWLQAFCWKMHRHLKLPTHVHARSANWADLVAASCKTFPVLSVRLTREADELSSCSSKIYKPQTDK